MPGRLRHAVPRTNIRKKKSILLFVYMSAKILHVQNLQSCLLLSGLWLYLCTGRETSTSAARGSL